MDAATAYLVALGDAAERGSQQARQIADEVAVGSLRTRLESALPLVAARIRARLVATRAPAAFEGWPLGYELLTVDRSRADVSVWHLDVVASSALGLVSAEYATTTYHLRWVGGVWRIETVTSISGPTPPDPGAPPLQVDAFAREAAAFARYHYVP